jgi:CRISPR-associated protein Cas1
MATLALMEQGLTLTVEGERFAVERNGRPIQQVRVSEVDEVLVFGGIGVTPAAVAMLLRHGIDTVFLTGRGRYRGRLLGRPGRNVELRMRQYERARDSAYALDVARGIVVGKVTNQRAILLRAQREQRRDDLAEAAGKLRGLLEAPRMWRCSVASRVRRPPCTSGSSAGASGIRLSPLTGEVAARPAIRSTRC